MEVLSMNRHRFVFLAMFILSCSNTYIHKVNEPNIKKEIPVIISEYIKKVAENKIQNINLVKNINFNYQDVDVPRVLSCDWMYSDINYEISKSIDLSAEIGLPIYAKAKLAISEKEILGINKSPKPALQLLRLLCYFVAQNPKNENSWLVYEVEKYRIEKKLVPGINPPSTPDYPNVTIIDPLGEENIDYNKINYKLDDIRETLKSLSENQLKYLADVTTFVYDLALNIHGNKKSKATGANKATSEQFKQGLKIISMYDKIQNSKSANFKSKQIKLLIKMYPQLSDDVIKILLVMILHKCRSDPMISETDRKEIKLFISTKELVGELGNINEVIEQMFNEEKE